MKGSFHLSGEVTRCTYSHTSLQRCTALKLGKRLNRVFWGRTVRLFSSFWLLADALVHLSRQSLWYHCTPTLLRVCVWLQDPLSGDGWNGPVIASSNSIPEFISATSDWNTHTVGHMRRCAPQITFESPRKRLKNPALLILAFRNLEGKCCRSRRLKNAKDPQTSAKYTWHKFHHSLMLWHVWKFVTDISSTALCIAYRLLPRKARNPFWGVVCRTIWRKPRHARPVIFVISMTLFFPCRRSARWLETFWPLTLVDNPGSRSSRGTPCTTLFFCDCMKNMC